MKILVRVFAAFAWSVRAAVLATCLATASAGAAQAPYPASAAVINGRLIHVDEASRVRVWNLQDASFDAQRSAQLSGDSIVQVATDGNKLWATSTSRLYSLAADGNSWKKEANLDGERPMAMAVVDGTPLLIFPRKVTAPTRKRKYNVPTLTGEQPGGTMRLRALALLTSRGTGSMLWIGTGMGEWGGHLVGLDPRAGKWVQYYDPLHYVTGITQDAAGKLMVSWSMSHFGAATLIRTHRNDARPIAATAELEDKYYQLIAYNNDDSTLYGVEAEDVVSIGKGLPTTLGKLQGKLFSDEPNAIGIAPGVSALLPVAARTLVIVPKTGLPWLLKEGKLERFAVTVP